MNISHANGLLQNAISTVGHQPKAENTAIPNFQSILDEAQNSEDAATAYDNYMKGPEHPFKNEGYIAEGVLFPPSDAPPEFLLAWDKTLNSLPEVQRVLLISEVIHSVEYGDYWGESVSDSQRAVNINNRIKDLGYRGIIELAVHSIEHELSVNMEFGNELIYINNIRDTLKNCQGMLDLFDSFSNKK